MNLMAMKAVTGVAACARTNALPSSASGDVTLKHGKKVERAAEQGKPERVQGGAAGLVCPHGKASAGAGARGFHSAYAGWVAIDADALIAATNASPVQVQALFRAVEVIVDTEKENASKAKMIEDAAREASAARKDKRARDVRATGRVHARDEDADAAVDAAVGAANAKRSKGWFEGGWCNVQ